jgi:hypothetical protein
MYRGWYKGRREWGSARVPWEFCLAEWNAQFLGDRDLHMIDVATVPNRLEDAVGKAESQKVLNRFFAKVVVHAVGLRFLQNLADGTVERDGGREVVPEGLFNDHAPPRVGIFPGEIGRTQMLDNDREKLRTDGQVEKAIPRCTFILLHLVEGRFQLSVEAGVAEIARDVLHAVDDPSPNLLVHRAP